MQYSTQARTYGSSQGTLISGSSTGNTGTANNGNKQIQSSSSYKIAEKKQTQVKRQSVLENQKNEEVFSSFPQLVISRVDSAEHRQKMKSSSSSNLVPNPLIISMMVPKTNRGDQKIVSTSMDKSANTYGGRQYISSNQSDRNRPSYRPNYATYRRDNNLAPNYGTGSGNGEQDGSDNQANQVPSYKVTGKYTVEMMDRDISPHMVSSVYSREEKDSTSEKNQKIYRSTRLKDNENSAEQQAYDLYASRHPDQSIRRSTIEISKAISSNAITQLQRQNFSQGQIIKKLEKQLDQFKGSLKKWDQIKHRYAMDLQSKSRQIFDLERANKRLTQQVQGIRTYRTMDTVQQVIIVRLKEQIMQLNKKIIEMQAQYYKNQKSLLQKTSKKQIKLQQQNDKQTIKKLQETTYMAKKEIQLLNIELQKQKQKSWKLEQQKQEYLAEKNFNKENYEKQITYLKKDVNGLRQQVQKNLQTIRQRQVSLDQVKSTNQVEIRKLTESLTRQLEQQKRLSQTQSNSRNLQIQKLNDQLAMKDRLMQQKISEQKNQFQLQLSQKLASKEQQSKNILNNQIRSLETQINNKTTLQIKKLSSQLNEKDRILQQKLAQQRVSFQRQMSQRLNQKEQEFKNILSDNEKNMKSLETQMNNQASSEIQKLSSQLNEKDRILEQRLNEQKKSFQQQLKDKLVQKQQQYKVALNNQMRIYESKIVEQGKTEKMKDSQNKQLLDQLKREKEQNQALLKRKIAEAEQSLKAANLKLTQKDEQLRTVESKDKNSQQITNQYLAEIQNLKRALTDSQNYIKDIQSQNENIKAGVRERDIQIEHLRVDNMKFVEGLNNQINQKAKWKQEESFIIQNQLKLKIQEQFKQKQRQLEAKVVSLSTQQQNIKQMRLKLEQDQQQQVLKVQAEIKQKQQKIQLQSIKQLQSTKTKLAEEVKKIQVNLSNINKEVAVVNSKKLQIQSQINLKQKQSQEIQVKIVQVKRDLQLKLNEVAQVESQKRNLTAQTLKLKQAEQKQKVVNKQYENKYNTTLTELNSFKIEYGKIQQKARQAEIQALRANQNINLWKIKSQNSQNAYNKLKNDMANLQKQKQQLKVKLGDAEENKAKGQIAKKYQQLVPEYELLKQKLQLKQEQAISRQSAIVNLRKSSESGESKISALVKQVRNMTNKIDEAEAKFKALLSKVQLEQYKYKQIYQKLVSDSEIYMTFIKKLQEDNELIAQKYWKVRKLVKKQKITDEHELLEKKDDNKYKIFLEKQILSHFNKMIIPQFETKILQKLTACEAYITNKQKRLKRVRQMIDANKKRRQARARSTN